jgi:putative sporulation protein YtaF
MLSKVIGALILFIIGIRILFITLRTKKARLEQNKKTAPYAIGDILHSPESADLDHSGSIGLWEAIVLGVAVSLNALTNGLSAGLMKFSPFGISMATAVFSYLAIWLGCHLGSKVATIRIGPWNMGQFSNVISAVLLLLIGLHTLL